MTLYPPNRLKRLLAERQTALGYWLSTNSLAVTEIAAGAGWDWLLLDMEHSLLDVESVERHLLAAHHAGPEAELVVRIPTIDPVLVKQLLDAGVRSFMFPFVQTVEEAQLAVASTRYPPAGIRGFSGSTRATRFGRDTDYLRTYADEICVIIQIESPAAVANISGYGQVDGIDAMLVGANDLAANMGHLGDTRHPAVARAVEDAGRAIVATGKAAGFQFFDERAEHLMGQGFTLAAVAGDINTLTAGMASELKRLRG
ncbi:MAG TPA: aldolase/citrate lyase family protein [Devosia sp.]|jgi:2-keto-3-deoxy-L-rhamnonate aldolase RhmA|nr:aldolase/citrate lyase family protein [Devosia sp.]